MANPVCGQREHHDHGDMRPARPRGSQVAPDGCDIAVLVGPIGVGPGIVTERVQPVGPAAVELSLVAGVEPVVHELLGGESTASGSMPL
ncbi:hypothetical protein [Dactylosporangium sp. CA-092794]|uniref:hypothetical protein n=1 Tax=Dactylosporangium sp. CA-092794 TaxID=3239929 RepID=UPI003D902A3A